MINKINFSNPVLAKTSQNNSPARVNSNVMQDCCTFTSKVKVKGVLNKAVEDANAYVLKTKDGDKYLLGKLGEKFQEGMQVLVKGKKRQYNELLYGRNSS